MRFGLVRYVSEQTDWQPRFALRRLDYMGAYHHPYLVMGKDNHPLHPFVFDDARQAWNWIRENAVAGSSLEWEGTTY